jgi:transcriptional regulator with XRE-family HTH domain
MSIQNKLCMLKFVLGDIMKYYERMRATREDKDLKQSDVAEMLNIKQQQYSEYERGLRLMPITYLFEFCRCMNISSDYILGLPDDLSHPKR